MNYKKLLFASLLAAAMAIPSEAEQPYGGCWHPDDIKNWSPETDPDAKFNRSRVPLAARFQEPETMKAHANQYYEGQVTNATILYPVCSMCPSQGADNFLGYQPTYWQYMDKLVYWAGSASEGIIIPPPAGSIDAAHQSGVKVLGQVFFPPSAFGGNQTWVRQMLTKENGKYIYAVKLYEIAKYIGFDGWFINEETGGGSDEEWAGFVKDFNAAADAAGDTHMEIQWYDAARYPNATILKAHKNTSQFLEYGATGDQRGEAKELGCTEAETFSKLYAGIQCVSNGLTGYGSYLSESFPSSGHVGSVALFCPEERAWKDNVKNYLGTTDACGDKAYEAVAKTFANEEKVWVNAAGDPSQTAATSWKGFSGHMVERSAITSIPFVSDMCVGVGKHRFVDGQKQGTQDWYHSGVQSVLPTWRFWIENRGDLKVNIDWDDAYNLGSSFKITGNLSGGDHLMRLYKTLIPVTNGGIISVAYKTNGDAPQLKLSTTSSTTPDVTLSANKSENKNGWTVAEYDLSTLSGKTIYMVGLNLTGANTAYSFSLGRVAILPANYSPTVLAVNNAKADADLAEEGGDIRLAWDFDWSNDFDHFDIYMTGATGRRLVGQTRDEAYYIPYFDRNPADQTLAIDICPVMKNGTVADGAKLTANYPAPTAPTIIFKPGKSYLAVGETTTLTFNATGNPTSYEWTLPEGLELVNGSLSDKTITVKALATGRQNVSLKATNSVGTTTASAEIIDVYSKDGLSAVYNVLLHKTIVSYSGSTNETESPKNLIDGVTTKSAVSQKWCNVAPDNWVIFDTEGLYRIYGFKIWDCKSGPENDENIINYTIELSLDGENWTSVVKERNRQDDNIKEDYIAPQTARYIRFSPTVAGTLRVWEFEAFGIDDINMTINAEPKELRLNTGETGEISVSYALNGDERMKEFNCYAKLANRKVAKTGEIEEDKNAATFTVPVTAGDIIGESDVTIQVKNGGAYVETVVKVIVDSPDAANVLRGVQAEVRHYKSDYSYEAKYDVANIPGLTDGNITEDAFGDYETPSTHKDDLWAIFTSDDQYNLAKVIVHIPGNNKGVNENEKEGFVNNEISIAVGDDLSQLERVKTFSNLAEVSKLEYIFPKARKAKYIAIICNLNVYFYPALAEIEAYEQLASASDGEGPVAMTGWDADVIAEKLPSASYVSDMIDYDGWAFFTSSLQEDGALCDETMQLTSEHSGLTYKIEAADSKNAIKPSSYSWKTLTPVEPLTCDKLYVLSTCSNGPGNLKVKVTYSDDTNVESTITIPDWYGDADEKTVKAGIYRIMADEYPYDYKKDEIDARSFRIFEHGIEVNPGKQIKNIGFQRSGYGSTPVVFAVSAQGAKSGIGGVTIDPNRTVVAIYNLQGVQVNNPENGIYIVRYSDGTTSKVLIKAN